MVPPVLKSNFNTLNCVLFCSLALKCTSTFITVLVKTTNNYICYLELRYKYNCYNYSHPGGVNTFLSCKSCELVPIFYYRDKTRLQIFYFLIKVTITFILVYYLKNQSKILYVRILQVYIIFPASNISRNSISNNCFW